MTFMPAFDRFPKECAIIGRLVAGFGELELGWIVCLALSVDGLSAAAEFIDRQRNDYVLVGDAHLKPYYEKLGLSEAYGEAIRVFNHCKDIRNKYAHSVWADTNGRLGFTKFGFIAKSGVSNQDLGFHPVDLKLLEAQLALFENCQDWLFHLKEEAQANTENRTQILALAPKTMELPPVHNPPESLHSFNQKNG